VIHFVEVKSGVEYESAVQNMTRTKISRLLKSIDVYIKKNSISRSSYMLDLVVVTPSGVEMLENITI
jgi:putative endonuclease